MDGVCALGLATLRSKDFWPSSGREPEEVQGRELDAACTLTVFPAVTFQCAVSDQISKCSSAGAGERALHISCASYYVLARAFVNTQQIAPGGRMMDLGRTLLCRR